MADVNPFEIAIVGGGISGLCLAIGLIERGVSIHVYESAPAFGEIGAGVALGPNAVRAMSMISSRLANGHAKITKDSRFEYRNGMKGPREDELVLGSDNLGEMKEGQSTVHRAAFLNVLAGLVPESMVTFGKKLIATKQLDGLERSMTMNFADGSYYTADAIIGCDGIKSVCRNMVLGHSDPTVNAVYSGSYAYRGLIPMHKAIAALGENYATKAQVYLGLDGHVLTFPIEQGRTMNVVAFVSKPGSTWKDSAWIKPVHEEKMEKDFSEWGSKVQNVIHLMEKSDVWALFNHLPAPSYHKGRLCLLGDSAHASTPHLGSGAGMGIEDALIMVELLSRIDSADQVEVAFETFEYIRKPRTQKLVAASRDAGYIYDFQMTGVWDDTEKLQQVLTERYRWIWKEDLAAEVKKASEIFKTKLAVKARQ